MGKEKINKGFTLSEVLITLTVIGVISALVIPMIMGAFDTATRKALLNKAISEMSSATSRISQDNGGTMMGVFPDGATFHSSINNFANTYSQYISMTKKCTSSNTDSTCWHSDNTWFDTNGNPVTGTCTGCRSFHTADGFWVFGSAGFYPNCDYNNSSGNIQNACISGIYIDVNGDKPPNKIGTDIFIFYITKDSFKPTKSTLDFLLNN